jgi:tryptophan synthase alpha chain
VSSSSITGSGNDFTGIKDYLQKLEKFRLKNPVLVGFGISDKQSFDTVCRYANGGIIGSAYIKVLQKSNNPVKDTMYFLRQIKGL